MGRTVFFSWQSDRSTREGRNLIEKALESAVSRIGREAELEEAVREGLILDKDTKGVPGSPPIFATILDKIDRATVFVPDLTFVTTRVEGGPMPNPNVLIEYGWALKSLGSQRIVAVMNEAHGRPTRESMPFDLAYHRFPITYNVPDGCPESRLREERDKLAKALQSALKAVFESAEFKASLPQKSEPPPFKAKDPMFGNARFRARKEPLGVGTDPEAEILGLPASKLFLSEGAAMWLRLMPAIPGRTWLVQELREPAMQLATLPLSPSAGEIGFVRSVDGCGYYRITGSETTPAVSFVFTTGEVWIINAWIAQTGPSFELNENGFIQSIDRCAAFLGGLGIQEPYRWVVGIEGIKDRYLSIPNRSDRVWGPCTTDMMKLEGTYRKGDNTAELLRSFLTTFLTSAE